MQEDEVEGSDVVAEKLKNEQKSTSRITTLLTENQRLLDDNKRLKNDLAQAGAAREDADQGHIMDLRALQTEMEQNEADHAQEKSTLLNRILPAESKARDMEAARDDFAKRLSIADAVISPLTQERDAAKQERDDAVRLLTKEREKTKADFEQLREVHAQEIQSIQDEQLAVRTRLLSDIEKLSIDNRKLLTDIEAEKRIARAEVDQTLGREQNRVTEIAVELDATKAKLKDMETQLQVDADVFRGRTESLESELLKKTEEWEVAQKSIAFLKSKPKAQDPDYAASQTALAKSNVLLDDAREQISKLSADLVAVRAENKKLRTAKESEAMSAADVEKLQASLESARDAHASTQIGLTEWRRRTEQIQAERDELQRKLIDAGKKAIDPEQVSKLSRKVSSLTSENKKLKTERDDLAAKLGKVGQAVQ